MLFLSLQALSKLLSIKGRKFRKLLASFRSCRFRVERILGLKDFGVEDLGLKDFRVKGI